MREGAAHDVDDVFVGKGVGDVPPVALAYDQVLGPQDAQPLGDGRQAVAGGDGEFRDAAGAGRQPGEQAEPALVADGSEQPDGAFDGAGTGHEVARQGGRMVVGMAVAVRVGSARRGHTVIMSTLNELCKCESDDPSPEARR